jgi:hypothetical protein
MSQEPPAAPIELEEDTRCEWCGADFEAAAPGQATTAARTPSRVSGTEPTTHCEWCGAEYPLPEPAREAPVRTKNGTE